MKLVVLQKPGAGSEKKIMGNTITDSFRLAKNYMFVLSGDVNDVYNNNSKKVTLQPVKFLEDNDNANIIMIRYSAQILLFRELIRE